jgi:hypothetical protein
MDLLCRRDDQIDMVKDKVDVHVDGTVDEGGGGSIDTERTLASDQNDGEGWIQEGFLPPPPPNEFIARNEKRYRRRRKSIELREMKLPLRIEEQFVAPSPGSPNFEESAGRPNANVGTPHEKEETRLLETTHQTTDGIDFVQISAKSYVNYPESSPPRRILRRNSRESCRTCKKLHIKCTGTHCRYYKLDTARQTISEIIEFRRVKAWRTTCEATHGGCCGDRHSEALAQQLACLNLVDVVAGSVVTLPSSTPFVALSYVWGSVTMLKAKRDNLEELKRMGALFEEPNVSALPNTVRDAMHVVKTLNERYLWVDCLSIVQDASKEEMDKMLNAMARIYASAEFTIVAADGGNANQRLRGTGGLSEKRKLSQQPDFVEGGFPWKSQWASRGWTFQETLFSRRLLVFNTVVSWVCGRCIWTEQQDDSDSDNTGLTEDVVDWPSERPHLGVPMGMMSLIPDKPSLGRWGMIVENYSSRNLTYEQDISRALAGATQVMAATFPGGLLHGLPVFFFDIALLWQPRTTLNRRPGEPSWSWIGWKGRVDCLSAWSPFYAGVFRKTGTYTNWITMAPLKPLATWEAFEANTAIDRKDFNAFYNYQVLRHDPIDALTPGWKKHFHPEGDFFTDADFASNKFQHAFPLPSVNRFQQNITKSSSSVLLCTAPVATALLGSLLAGPSADGSNITQSKIFSLMHHDTSIGSLVVHDDQDPRINQGRSCELIAISEGELKDIKRACEHPLLYHYSASQGHCDDDASVSPLRHEDRSFYNVLWVERKSGVAYRKGLGMVSKRGWGKVDAQMETLALG